MIGIYLKGTNTKGLILNPSKDFCNINCYTDDNFMGIYGHGNTTDPSCIKIGTGYCITFEIFPVLWK